MKSHPSPVRRALSAALCFVILHSSFVISRAAEPDLRTLLRDALFEEEATRDLDKAAAGYESLLTKWNEQRQFAAAALYRLAEVRRKQGRKDDAIKLYQRLVTEFADQDPHARLSRENLAALGAKEPAPATPGSPAAPAASDEEATALARVQKLAVDSPDLLVGNEFTDACKNGWLSVVKFLISKKVTDKGEGLREAAKNGHLAVIRELLALKPLPAWLGSAVEAAAQNNRLAVLKLLLENGASPDGGNAKLPPLGIALDQGHPEIAELLLEHKASVNPPAAIDPPLFAAAMRGNAPMVERLLSLGADPRQGTRQTRGAQVSRPQGNFIIDSAGSTPLHAAVSARNADCVSLLLKGKADPNAANEADWAPLHGAANLGDVRVIDLLLAAGAKPDGLPPSPEKDLQSPLWLAIQEGKVPTITALLKGKADPNILHRGYTPMTLAVTKDPEKLRDEMVAALLDYGADPTAGQHSAIQNATSTALRIKLLRGYQYPKLAAKPEITLVAGNLAVENSLALLQTPDEKPASLPSLLLAWHESGGWKQLFSVALDWSAVRLFRKGGDGKMTETVIPIKTGAEFPGLQWGDVIEIISRNPDSSPHVPRPGNAVPQPAANIPGRARVVSSPQSTNTANGLPPEILAILRDTQTARIKLTAGGITRDLLLRGKTEKALDFFRQGSEGPPFLAPGGADIIAGRCAACQTGAQRRPPALSRNRARHWLPVGESMKDEPTPGDSRRQR